MVIPSTMGTHQGDILINALFILIHFRTLHFIANHFPFCLFPSIVDDTHIIGPFSIVSSAYEHFQFELNKIGLSIEFLKCATWSPYGLLLNFDTPSLFNTPSEGIKVLGVPLGTSSSTSSFIENVLLEDVWHVDLLLKMGDVHVIFGILTHYFMQWPLYLL
jgi:hypothetical protein